MKKIFVAIMFVVVSFGAQAEYCDTRGAECWKFAAEAAINQIRAVMYEINQMPITPEYRDALKKSYADWSSKVDNKCNNNRCVASYASQYRDMLYRERYEIRQQLKKAGK